MAIDMKSIPLAIAVMLTVLIALPVEAQDRPGAGPQNRDTSVTVGRPTSPHQKTVVHDRAPKSFQPGSKTVSPGIGICLIGEKYAYIVETEQADQCDAVLWTSTVVWANNQRKLLDQSTIAGESSTTAEGETFCRSCRGTCQTVSLPIKDSNYQDIETDGGQSPSECLTRIKDLCESGSFRHFVSARCGN